MIRRLASLLKTILVWASVTTFTGASLLASGVMPAKVNGGAIVLVICSGTEMVEVAFDPVTMQPLADQPDGPTPSADGQPCRWATIHPSIAAVQPPPLTAPIIPASAVPGVDTPVILRIEEATGLPPATGPPSLFRDVENQTPQTR